MKNITYFFIALFQLLVVSCDFTADSQLYRADKVINNNPDSAFSILNSIDSTQIEPGNSLLSYRLLKIQAQIERGDSISSDSIISKVMRLTEFNGHDSLRMKACYYDGVIKSQLGDTLGAVKSLTEAQVIANHINKGYWLSKSKKTLEKLFYSDSVELQSTDVLKKSSTLAHIQALNHFLGREQHKYVIARHIIVSISVFVLLLLVLVAVSFWMNARSKSTESARRMERILMLNNEIFSNYNEIQHLTEELGTNQSAQRELHAKIGSLFKEQWSTINKLCDRYLEADGSKNKSKILASEVEREVSKMRRPETFYNIESAVNEYMDDIMSVLRNECSFLSESDFLFISMIYAGLSPRTICLIFDIKFKTYYTRRTRLAERIMQSEAPHKAVFLSKLMKLEE